MNEMNEIKGLMFKLRPTKGLKPKATIKDWVAIQKAKDTLQLIKSIRGE